MKTEFDLPDNADAEELARQLELDLGDAPMPRASLARPKRYDSPRREKAVVPLIEDQEPLPPAPWICARPGCGECFTAETKRRGGGTRNRAYCSFECQQAAYRLRHKAKVAKEKIFVLRDGTSDAG